MIAARTTLVLFLSIGTLPGQVLAQSQELILPVFVTGSIQSPVHFQTALRLLNASSAAGSATLNIFNDSGAPIRGDAVFCDGGPLNPPPFRSPNPFDLVFGLAGDGSVEISSLGGAVFLSGWARLRHDGTPIQTVAEIALISAAPFLCIAPICMRPSTQIVTIAVVPAVRPSREFRANASLTSQRESAYALVNPSSSQTATIEIIAADSSGRILDQNTIRVPAQGRVAKFLWELLLLGKVFVAPPKRPNFFHGSVKITSDIPIAVGALNVLSPEGKFAGLPVNSP